MILLPEFYDDELVHSLLARAYVRSGYIGYKRFANEVLEAGYMGSPSKDYIPWVKPEVLKELLRYHSCEDVIFNHTMYPCYCRFLPKDRKYQAIGIIKEMKRDGKDIAYAQGSLRPQNMRYCPICAKDDIGRHGETYWHRAHQIAGIDICPKHRCRLIETDVVMEHGKERKFQDANSKVNDLLPDFTATDIEKRYADYAFEVFLSPIDFDNEVRISDVIKKRLEKPPYNLKYNDYVRYIRLSDDLQKFYQGFPYVHKLSLVKTLSDDAWRFSDICMFGLFLGMPPSELASPKLAGNS